MRQSIVLDPAQNRRSIILAMLYSLVIAGSFGLAYEVRFDFVVPVGLANDRVRMLWVVIGVKLVALVLAGQLGSMMTYFSIPDLMRLGWGMVGSSVVLLSLRFIDAAYFMLPRGVLLSDFVLCLSGLCVARLVPRIYRERISAGRHLRDRAQQRIAIIGAGDAGASLAREFVNSPSRGFTPVMFFDDDVEKRGKLIHNVPVLGRPEFIADPQAHGQITKAVIAMPSAPAKRVAEIAMLFAKFGIKVETMPSIEELASGRVRASRIRPVEVEDLLGRETVDLDSAGIRRSIQDRVVLVTGAGGSIGSELCRQIAALAPQRLLMLDQAEGSLFNVEQELSELGLGTHAVALVGDILDEERMRFIFSHYQPEIVFHAAAHKHVYMMERQPAEAIRNNVLGTRLLARIATETGVNAFVLISTDKAINPTSVMGATKRLAELQMMAIASSQTDLRRAVRREGRAASRSRAAVVVADPILDPTPRRVSSEAREMRPIGFNIAVPPRSSEPGLVGVASHRERNTKFMAVRFGNVLGSSGSVIPIFKRQIANGGPLTVTHPDVTRYFMTIPESVGLVLQASILGAGGEIFVLDMGRPVRILDLARQMIELSGFKVDEDIEIKFTGLKPGEKLYEELQHKTELFTSTEHPRIMRFTSSAMFSESGVRELQQRLYELEPNALKLLLKRLVPEYTPFLD